MAGRSVQWVAGVHCHAFCRTCWLVEVSAGGTGQVGRKEVGWGVVVECLSHCSQLHGLQVLWGQAFTGCLIESPHDMPLSKSRCPDPPPPPQWPSSSPKPQQVWTSRSAKRHIY